MGAGRDVRVFPFGRFMVMENISIPDEYQQIEEMPVFPFGEITERKWLGIRGDMSREYKT